jgi:hypothetical protein
MNDAERWEYLPELISLPLPTDQSHTPSLLQNFPNLKPIENSKFLHKKIKPDIEKLLEAAMQSGSAADEALLRLSILFDVGILSAQEQATFAKRIWSHVEGGFPNNTTFYDYALLDLPAPQSVPLEDLFRQAYFDPNRPNPFDLSRPLQDSKQFHQLESRLRCVQVSLFGYRKRKGTLTLSKLELETLASRILALIDSLVVQEDDPLGFVDRRSLLTMSEAILANAIVPNFQWEATELLASIRQRLPALEKQGVSTMMTRLALSRLQPDEHHTLSLELMKKLRSHNPKIARDAITALSWWLSRYSNWKIQEPGRDLRIALANIVEDHWPPILAVALHAASEMAKRRDWVNDQEVQDSLLSGLVSLKSKATYKLNATEEEDSPIPIADVPSIRRGCVTLATTLAASGLISPTIKEWLREAVNDPLPEVRHAAEKSPLPNDPDE